ncbi:hypothetical protein D3C75_805850 [compost metagenome]
MMMVCSAGGACTTVVAPPSAALCTVTVCCSLDSRLPAACAWRRRRCTESITSLGWARKASPTRCTQAGSWPRVTSSAGKATNDCTLGSQGWSATWRTASSPLASGWALDQATASATLPG